MPTLTLSEFSDNGTNANGGQRQCAQLPSLTHQNITIGASSVQSAALQPTTTLVRLSTDTAYLYGACLKGAQDPSKSEATRAFLGTVTLAKCKALLSTSDVSTDAPFDALARLGLQLVQQEVTP